MQDIVEQAKQSPPNGTPIGWDDACVRYPGVNTCMTVTAVPNAGPIVGLHLGLVMHNTGSDGKLDPSMPQMLDQAYVDLYLWALRARLGANKAKRCKFYIAGAKRVWRPTNPVLWDHLCRSVDAMKGSFRGTLDVSGFDDDEEMTVDIYVDNAGVRYTAAGGDTAVTAID